MSYPSRTAPRWSNLALIATSLVVGVAGYWIGANRTHSQSGDRAVPSQGVSDAGLHQPVRAPVGEGQSDAANRGSWENAWQRTRVQPRSARVGQQMAAMLAELARHDPGRAMALASAESSWVVRSQLQNAVLERWAETDASAAADWAMGRPENERVSAISAVLTGAATNPEAATRLGASLCDRDPAREAAYGRALLTALSDRGAFATAVQFAIGRPPSPLRVEETETAFNLWSQQRPEQAAVAVEKLSDHELHEAAFHGLIIGWSEADPAAVADYATRLPAGDLRAQAVANAMPRWVEQDPLAAATWLAQRDPQPDFDSGVVAVATLPTIINQRPELAMTLAQSIADAPLRVNTLQIVALKWAETDALGARRYVETSANFSATERKLVLGEMGVPQAN